MKTIDCPVCGEKTLGLRTGPGRTMKHRNMEVEVPADFALPECSACGARPIDWRTAKQLDPLLEAAWQARLASTVEADLTTLGAIRPLYEWERVLNLSVGYLSKIRGEKKPSAQLVALLRLLANHPERVAELDALWAGIPGSVVIAESQQLSTTPPAPPSRLKPRLVLVQNMECILPARVAA